MKKLSLFLCLSIFLLFNACSSKVSIAEGTCQIGKGTPCEVSDFTSCVAAGNKVLKTFPGRCIDGKGNVFHQVIPSPLPIVNDPLPHLNDLGEGLPHGKKTCIDQCGNGRCEEIVCLAQGCPCAESEHSCPADCRTTEASAEK